MKTTLILSGLFLAIIPVFGQTWTQTGANTNYEWGSVASSADGTKLVASAFGGGSDGVFLSTNSGATWALCSGLTDAGSLVSSADGTKLAAISGNYVYTSTNSGGTWSATGTGWDGSLGGLALSADGNTLLAWANGGGIYISTNAGSTWLLSTNPAAHWENAVCSANGTMLAALVNQDDPSAYVSTNAGATWQKTSSFEGQPGEGWLHSTADGSKLIVEGIVEEVPSYLSTNWGQTWSQVDYLSGSWFQTGSADGSVLLEIIPTLSVGIYTSTNFGMTWTSSGAPQTIWNAAACSADGKKLFAAAGSAVNPGSPSTNGIWSWQLPPAPKINVLSSTGAINFSWLVPSTNMVLEESPDLNNWTTLTNCPSIDFTNLQEQLTLSATNGSGFFRLISQ